jgi:hypothetical protein
MNTLYCKGAWGLVALILYLVPSMTDAQCNVNVTLSSQAQVDAFPATYGCAEFTGTITISGSDITNLDSLYVLKSIGRLFVNSNPNLANLHGLSNVQHVGSSVTFPPFALTITGNPLLIDLTGLSSLQDISNGGLVINSNASLASFKGLDSLRTIGGTIQTMNNASLSSLNGMNSLETIGTFNNVCWVVGNNGALVNMKGFPLTTLPGRFIVSNNPSLVNLVGLDSVTRINGSLYIVSNPSLRTLDGLGGLTEIGGPNKDATLLVGDNSSLQNLDGLESLRTISGDNISTGIIISRNASLQDVSALSSLDSLNGFLQIVSNPMLSTLEGLGGVKSLRAGLEITDNDGLIRLTELTGLSLIGPGISRDALVINGNRLLKNLKGLDSVTAIPGGVLITGNDSLRNLSGLDAVTLMGGTPYPCCVTQLEGNVRITSNPSLKNVDALSNVTTVYHGLFIDDNVSLKNLDGLLSLTRIKVLGTNPPAQLEIKNNLVLKNINGLSSLTVMEGNKASVVVTGNTSLAQCCGLYPLLSNGLGCDSRPSCATVTISGNGAGCTKEDILANGACGGGTTVAMQQATFYPNPTTGELYFEVADDFVGLYSLSIYDLTNQLIKQQTVSKEDRSLKTEINLQSVKKGLYVLKVKRSDGEIFQERLAVQD